MGPDFSLRDRQVRVEAINQAFHNQCCPVLEVLSLTRSMHKTSAVSSSKCNGWMMAQLRRDFQGRRNVETFPRACVHAMRDGVQLALGIARQVRALGQVLAQEAMGVLVGAALPGAVRIGKEDLAREPLGQALMFGHLFPPIIG